MRVREARLSDYDQIGPLVSRYELETKSPEEWRHLWEKNPVFQERRETWPIGWVLENDQAKVVGYLGNIPLAYEFRGKRLIAAATHSWVVDESSRKHSLLLLTRYFAQKGVDLYLNTTANAEASRIFEALQARRVPEGESDRSLFWITHHVGFAESLLKIKGMPAASVFKYPLGFVSGLFGAVKKKPLKPLPQAEVISLSSFDSRFDDFWKKLKEQRSGRLLRDRSQEYLNWHFEHSLRSGKMGILAIEENSRLRSYAIFQRQDTPAFSLKRMRLIDFQTLASGPVASQDLEALMGHALNKCRKQGIHMLESIGVCSEKRAMLEALRPYRRKLPTWLYFYKTRDRVLAQEMESPLAWDPAGLDGDASL